MTLLPVEYVYVVQCYNQWRSEGRAWPGTCPANVRRVVPLVARDMWARALVLLAQWLSVYYSRCPANTNDLATPLATIQQSPTCLS